MAAYIWKMWNQEKDGMKYTGILAQSKITEMYSIQDAFRDYKRGLCTVYEEKSSIAPYVLLYFRICLV